MLPNFSTLILDIIFYKLGSKDINECPKGYETIKDENTCELASTALRLRYHENANENNSNAVCFGVIHSFKGDVHKKYYHIDDTFYSGITKETEFKLICQKGMHLTAFWCQWHSKKFILHN